MRVALAFYLMGLGPKMTPESVNSKSDFVQFVEGLCADLAENPDEWENPTLDRFLDAIAAWAAASDNYYRNTAHPVSDNVSWRFFAEVLAAARSYE
jgi:hypothetical protein